jgi:ABC-type phosphate transport system substrate-binding protein
MIINKRLCALLLALGLGASPSMASAFVVPVVSAKSTLTTLSENEVADIFLGKLNRLPDGEALTPIDQAEGAEVRDEFYLKFGGRSQAQVKAHWSKVIFTGRGKPPRRVNNSAEVKKLLSENPNAIGYIDSTAVDDSVKVLQIRK